MKSPLTKTTLILVIFSLGILNPMMAKVTLPSFFTDNMVLQQKSSVPLWGQADADSKVKITTSWDKKNYTAQTAADGSWSVNLKTPSYGGPYTITIDNGEKRVLKDILIGEVWLCSGQSNMEMPLEGWGKINNYQKEINDADYPQIRLLQAELVNNATPLNDLKVQQGGWKVCSPESIKYFSATAYFFARKVYREKHIPIGLIQSAWGGTYIEAWTSSEALKTTHDFDETLAALQSETSNEILQKKFDAEMKVWNAILEKADKGMKEGKPIWAEDQFNDASWQKMKLPAFWENAQLGDFDGIVWFRKTINIPESLIGSDVQLQYYADDDDKVWVNGTLIGATSGYNVYRNYTIPANVLKKGANNITIRVFDGSSGGGIYGNPDDMLIKANGKILPLSGEWKYEPGVNLSSLPAAPNLPQGQNRPTSLFNAMIHPLLKIQLAGVIWYQGENNAERAQQYQTLFPLMIKDWRKQFGQKDLPFFYVQLANYRNTKKEPEASSWAELREAQLKALELPNTGMAVITDIGDAGDIHPKNKQDVGDRLARIALAKVYGVNIPYSGPMFKSFDKNNKAITIIFSYDHALKAKGDSLLKGFSIAGADKVFHWATAKIEGNKVVVSSPEVPQPVAVRYNWADNPEGNLSDGSDLPASSFRTDDWQGITYGKK